jgi:peptidoglycan/xylan/chitin deacetylase (PgdA/CDA1 family)
MVLNIINRIKSISRPKAVILMYHQVCERRCDPWELAVHPNHFYDQLDYLKKHVNVVPVSALAEGIATHSLKKSVAITFDDGFKDNYTNAAPLLDWHELQATFYVATTPLQSRHGYWWDTLQEIVFHSDVLPESFEMTINENLVRFIFRSDRALNSRVMNQTRAWNYNLPIPNERIALYMLLWHHIKPLPHEGQKEVMAQICDWARYRDECRADAATMNVRELQSLAANSLFSVGAHSVHHPMLSQQSAVDQAFEVRESKRQLENWLGRSVNGFAYPYGNFNSTTQSLLKKMGFAHAVSTESKPVTAEDDPFALPRIQVKNWCVYEFASKLNEIVND